MKLIYKELAKELNLPERVVEKVYNTYWYAIKQFVTSVPIVPLMTEELFNKLQASINIPSLGKLAATYDRYIAKEQQLMYKKKCSNLKKLSHSSQE